MNDPLPYATVSNAPSSRSIIAGIAIGVLGLGLIVMGGCFLIGILIMHTHAIPNLSPFDSNAKLAVLSNYWTPGRIFFATVLYICATVAFGGAILLLIISVRKRLKA